MQERAQARGAALYQWRYSAPAVAEDPAVLSPLDRAPRLFASTFPDWQTFSRSYAALARPRAALSPRIQAVADQVTAGIDDRREQARRVYDWVSRHIRWVAIWVGDGNFVPHAAEDVLAQGYGDCKDQAVLLIALLRAKGIEAEMVLINLAPSYTLSGPPTYTAFNHVIVYSPELDVYMDTTAGGAPFGTLRAEEYGKPILVVTDAGSAPDQTPVLPPGLATERLRTTMRLEQDGRIIGESVSEAAGPYATALRQTAMLVFAQGGQRAAAERLRALGEPGQGDITPAPIDPIGPEYRVSASFTLDARQGILEGDSFVVPTGILLLQRPGDGLLGPIARRDLPASEPTPCWAGEQEEDLSLALPPGRRPARLPRNRTLEGSFFRYESRWIFADDTITVRRHLVSRIDQPLCERERRAEAARALAEIRRDLEARIALNEAEQQPGQSGD